MTADYELFLREQDLTDLRTNEILIPFPYKPPIEERPSLIEGVGMFALVDLPAWFFICHLCIKNRKTPAGRKINHDPYPNTVAIYTQTRQIIGDVVLVACRNIEMNEEITINYRQTNEVNKNGLVALKNYK